MDGLALVVVGCRTSECRRGVAPPADIRYKHSAQPSRATSTHPQEVCAEMGTRAPGPPPSQVTQRPPARGPARHAQPRPLSQGLYQGQDLVAWTVQTYLLKPLRQATVPPVASLPHPAKPHPVSRSTEIDHCTRLPLLVTATDYLLRIKRHTKHHTFCSTWPSLRCA